MIVKHGPQAKKFAEEKRLNNVKQGRHEIADAWFQIIDAIEYFELQGAVQVH